MTTENVVEKSPKVFDKIKLPKKYKVVILNDNFTPFEFVMLILMTIFKHPENIAKDITLKIHNEGSAVVGIYNYEIAEQKVFETTSLARANSFPLESKYEPE